MELDAQRGDGGGRCAHERHRARRAQQRRVASLSRNPEGVEPPRRRWSTRAGVNDERGARAPRHNQPDQRRTPRRRVQPTRATAAPTLNAHSAPRLLLGRERRGASRLICASRAPSASSAAVSVDHEADAARASVGATNEIGAATAPRPGRWAGIERLRAHGARSSRRCRTPRPATGEVAASFIRAPRSCTTGHSNVVLPVDLDGNP